MGPKVVKVSPECQRAQREPDPKVARRMHKSCDGNGETRLGEFSPCGCPCHQPK